MEIEKQGRTLEDDEIRLYIEEDEVEGIYSYAVLLYSLGYLIDFSMDSAQAASDLFDALKHVKEIEAD